MIRACTERWWRKGDFEVGAVRCLNDQGIVPSLVCTTSVGSANALKVAEDLRHPGTRGGLALPVRQRRHGQPRGMDDRRRPRADVLGHDGSAGSAAPSSPTLAAIASLPKLESAIDITVNNVVTGSSVDIDLPTTLRLAGFLPIAGQMMGLLLGDADGEGE